MRSNAFYLAPVSLLEKIGVKPIVLTIVGAIITSASGIFFALGKFIFAGIIMGIGGLFDLYDGELARRTKQVTKFGGFIDSNLDRIAEFVIYLGLFLYYPGNMKIIIFAALFATQMVSYARARAEGGGFTCRTGFFTRGLRFIFLFIGSMLGQHYMRYVLVLILIGSSATFLERFFIVKEQKS